MKEAWVRMREWSKEVVTTALEGGADALIVPSGWRERIEALGRIVTVGPDGDLKPGEDVFFEPLESPEDEARIGRLLQLAPVVLLDYEKDTASPKGSGEHGNTVDLRLHQDFSLRRESDRSPSPPREGLGEGANRIGSPPSPRPSPTEGRGSRADPPLAKSTVLEEHGRWEVIPLENLVAGGGKLIVPVASLAGLDLALGVLEKGVAGVVIDCPDPAELKTMLTRVKAVPERETLTEARIESIRPAGIGDRVCVDTCTLMEEGEGLLVGNSSGFLFLVQAEAKTNPYVAPRPFRVNAGPVHAYTRTPGGRTRYLSELRAGDPVLVVRARGEAQTATVGRVKIERRPLLLIEAECGAARGSIILQNAETIRLTAPDGTARSVVELKPGDTVLVAVEEAGRHFGRKVRETIREK